jgi:hypothetical protein
MMSGQKQLHAFPAYNLWHAQKHAAPACDHTVLQLTNSYLVTPLPATCPYCFYVPQWQDLAAVSVCLPARMQRPGGGVHL